MKKLVMLLCFLALLILCTCRFLLSFVAPPAQNVSAPALSRTLDTDQILFPDLDPSIVTAVSIRTPQSTFDMRRSGDHGISINGHHGDNDVFSTMLSHIAAIDFVSTQPFSAPEAPLLTLVIHQHDEEFTASFYSDGRNGEYTRLIASREQAPVYGLTEGWRVGTLMLACEGTRIQDASGREIPIE